MRTYRTFSMIAVAALALAAAALLPARASAGTNGLVAAYNFNEGSGTTLHDVSGNGNDGYITNATWSSSGVYGGALSFDGSSSIVHVSDAASLDLTSGMTLEAWVNPATLGAAQSPVLFKEGSGFDLDYALYANSNCSGCAYGPFAKVNMFGGVVSASNYQQMSANTWTYLAMTYDGSNLDLYENGQLVAQDTITGSAATGTGPLDIGGSIFGEHFAGLLDDVRIYNRALSASEILTDLQTPVSGGTAPAAPTGLAATSGDQTSLTVSWTASADPVAGYSVYVNGAHVDDVTTGTSYTFTGLTCGTSYTLSVDAYDSAGDHSAQDGTTASTANCGTGGGSPGLVAEYSFNQGSGTTLTDISGNGNDGTISNATWVSGGTAGDALSFDGSSSIVHIPDSASLDLTTGMTLEAYVKPSSLSSASSVLFKEGPSFNLSYALYAADGSGLTPAAKNNTFGSVNAASYFSPLSTGVWTHLAETYDGTYLDLYVNGQLVGQQLVSGSMPTGPGPLDIGGNGYFGEHFAGLIDDVRVYNRALSASEIQTDSQNPLQ